MSNIPLKFDFLVYNAKGAALQSRTSFQRSHKPSYTVQRKCTGSPEDGFCTCCGRAISRKVLHNPNLQFSLGYIAYYSDGSYIVFTPQTGESMKTATEIADLTETSVEIIDAIIDRVECRLQVDHENNGDQWWENGGREIWAEVANGKDEVHTDRATASAFVTRSSEIPGWFSGPEYAPNPIIAVCNDNITTD